MNTKFNFRFLVSFLAMGLIAFTLTACGGESSHSHEHEHKTEEHDGHNHEHNHDGHEGHNHDSHESHDHESHEGHDHSSHEGHDHGEKASVDMTSMEYASVYVCPMHCEGSGSKEAGKCPKCGMEYVLNAEHQEDGHKH